MQREPDARTAELQHWLEFLVLTMHKIVHKSIYVAPDYIHQRCQLSTSASNTPPHCHFPGDSRLSLFALPVSHVYTLLGMLRR